MSELLSSEAALASLPDWRVLTIDDEPRLSREFKFDDFKEALSFTNKVGELAEANNHHPLLHTTWGSVTVEWWSHDAGGITQADVDMATKTDKLV